MTLVPTKREGTVYFQPEPLSVNTSTLCGQLSTLRQLTPLGTKRRDVDKLPTYSYHEFANDWCPRPLTCTGLPIFTILWLESTQKCAVTVRHWRAWPTLSSPVNARRHSRPWVKLFTDGALVLFVNAVGMPSKSHTWGFAIKAGALLHQ